MNGVCHFYMIFFYRFTSGLFVDPPPIQFVLILLVDNTLQCASACTVNQTVRVHTFRLCDKVNAKMHQRTIIYFTRILHRSVP